MRAKNAARQRATCCGSCLEGLLSTTDKTGDDDTSSGTILIRVNGAACEFLRRKMVMSERKEGHPKQTKKPKKNKPRTVNSVPLVPFVANFN
jgi:hypothetical protein